MKGNVTITAGQTASVRASDIIAGKDTLITGRNVDIESKDNTYRGKEEHEYKKSGLTVSLGGAVITAKDNIIRPIKNAGQAHDGLLGKLYAADAGFNLHDAVKTYKNIGDVKKGITLDVSLGTQSAKSDSRYQGTEAKESRIVSKGNVRIKSDENIAVKGSQITGENVTLQAGKDIHLTAAENRKTAEGNSRSKGAGITASFGIGGLQNVGISAGKSKGNMEEEIITHTGSAVTAKNTLTMESGKDIDIKGSKAGGKKVEIKTGNNLSIESLQDSHAYHSRDKESGIHLQRDITARPDTGKKKMDDPYFSIGKKTDTTDSTYISVTKQAGIYAGKEGYDIQVKNNTHLKGAVIDSQAEKEKNRITTGTLTWENIDNKAEYKTGGHGISYNGKIGRGDKNDSLDSRINNRYGKDAITGQRNGINKITPTIYGSKIPLNERGLLNTPIPSVKGKAGTTTRSAISKGTITITDKENQKQDIEKLNRNTENSLNKLKEIFDKTKVEERKRLLEELGIVGNRAIHEIASHNGWKDGSTEKIALHGMLGAITSAKSGGSALSGLIAGGANEYAIGYLKKTKGKDWINKHPDTVQNISAAFGGILSKMTGGSGHTGAYISQMGTKWNLQLDEHAQNIREKLWKEQKKTYDNEYVDNENVGDAYTNLEISSAEANLESRYKQSTQMKLAPVATELLGYYMDGDNSKHGITNIEYTEHGLRVVEFGETSVLNKVLRNDKPINMRFIKDTLNYAGKSPIITSADSYSFYTSGVDLALGLGSATAITSIKFEEGKILAKITVTDHYDFGKKEANAGDFLKSAYILQQSGRKKTFAYKTTYDVTYTIDEFLDYILKGIGD